MEIIIDEKRLEKLFEYYESDLKKVDFNKDVIFKKYMRGFAKETFRKNDINNQL